MVVAGGAARSSSRAGSQVVARGCMGRLLRERPHPNKRLKLSAPAGAGWRCHLGRRACHKEVVDFIRCGGSRRSLSAGTLASLIEQGFFAALLFAWLRPARVQQTVGGSSEAASRVVIQALAKGRGALRAEMLSAALATVHRVPQPGRFGQYGRAKPKIRSRAPSRVFHGSLADLRARRQAA